MRLYLLRHANADTVAATDDERALSEKGIAQAKRVAGFCKAHDVQPALVLTSPVRRAHETALIVAPVIGTELLAVPWLACGMRPQTALEELCACRSKGCVMLVGHEPDFSELAAHLLGLPTPTALHIRKASLLLLNLPVLKPGAARLEFALPCCLM